MSDKLLPGNPNPSWFLNKVCTVWHYFICILGTPGKIDMSGNPEHNEMCKHFIVDIVQSWNFQC